MATASCSTVSFVRRQAASVSASTSVSITPTYLGRRKNYLRPKILITLTKPYPTPTTLIAPIQDPVQKLETPEAEGVEYEVDVKEVDSGVRFEEESRGGVEVEGGTVLVGTELGVVGKFLNAKIDKKVVFYAIGIFVVQAVCALWIFESGKGVKEVSKGEKENEGVEKERVSSDGRLRRVVAKASKVVKVDEAVLEERIARIKAMAREVRKMEARKGSRKGGGLGEDEDDDDDDDDEDEEEEEEEEEEDLEVDGIEKEVSTRLERLHKKLDSGQVKVQGASVNYMRKAGEGEKGSVKESASSKELNGSFVFKKKETFKISLPTSPKNGAKGFGLRDQKERLSSRNVTPRDEDMGSDISEQIDSAPQSMSDEDSNIDVPSSSKHDVDKKLLRQRALELKRRIANKTTGGTLAKPNAGIVQGGSYGKPMGTSNASVDTDASKQEIGFQRDALVLNGISRNNGVKIPTADGKVLNKGAEKEIDMWWMHRPCVFAIVMRQGSGNEGSGGLYTLQATSKVPKGRDGLYTVAFEDHSEASNFCYILESFFEDMGNFSADVVPLPIKEIREAYEAGVRTMIMVKKGQLKLYAGQPLAEVEALLRSLVA